MTESSEPTKRSLRARIALAWRTVWEPELQIRIGPLENPPKLAATQAKEL